MAAETFSYTVKAGASGGTKFRTRSIAFGDGYRQGSGDGLNAKSRSWNITKDGPAAELQPVKDFIDRHEGYKRFNWTPPNGVAGLFTCEGYNESADVGTEGSMNAMFVEAFQP